MNVHFPTWLEEWISLDEPSKDLYISISENKCKKYKQAIFTVKWSGNSGKVTNVQLNLKVTDPRVECTWKPHLSPEEDMVIGDRVFRSPVMIFEKEDKMFALVPDVDLLEKERIAPHFMDYVETNRSLCYGISHYEKTKHVYFKKIEKPFQVERGQTLFRFHLLQWEGIKDRRNFILVTDFVWECFAQKRMVQNNHVSTKLPEAVRDLEIYVKHTYNWAFKHWEKVVWNEFELEQKKVGGCVFIVRGVQTPGMGLEDNWREKKSIWNQAWFSSLRSAYGYRLWGEKWKNTDMIRRSNLAKNFALSAPQTNGLFPSVYWAGPNHSWENGCWGYSDRRPENHEEYAHLLDMSWTCLWMLKWYMNIEQDNELVEYTKRYIDRLLGLQAENGSFPGWVHVKTGAISPYLIDSPETSMHVWLLAKFYQITGENKYLLAAVRGMEFVLNNIIPIGRWEDFETYWSCSKEWNGKRYGKKDKRSGLYNQCNFSIYWTVEALKEMYLVTKEDKYIKEGEKVLAELSLYQAIWQPAFLYLPVLGGFGVMTSDDEWNDARQSLFALTYQDYYEITRKEEYKYRSIWATKASFYMMYCPENVVVKQIYENTFQYFGEKDYGFEMENAHHGSNNEEDLGEFTIFDWGNGAAAASLVEIVTKQGKEYANT
ncbi:hypothetical protein ACLM5H_13360 [Fredinandcohnia humi]